MTGAASTVETNLRRQYLGPAEGRANIAWLLAMHGLLIAGLWFGAAALPLAVFVPLGALGSLIHQRILSEWFHEATHWNLLPDRRWNDLCSDVLIGPLNGTRVRANRPGHFRHHAVDTFFTADDPDTCGAIARDRRDLWAGVLRDLTGITAVRQFLRTSAGGSGTEGPDLAWLTGLLVLHGATFAATLAAQRPAIYPVYFGALLCLYPLANRLRLYAQHADVGADGRIATAATTTSRTAHAGLLEQLLLHSPMIMYHHEHHAQPSLPYRALRAISALSDDPNVSCRSALPLIARVLLWTR